MPSSSRSRARRQDSSSSHASRSSHRSHRSHRKKSTDSYRSKPKRSGTTDSSHSSRSHRRESDRPTRKNSTLPDLLSDLPPPYHVSEAQNAGKPTEEPEKRKPMGPISRVTWGLALTLPLLASVFLLFLFTASSSSLRTDFSVIKISVDGATLDGLIGAAKKVKDGQEDSVLGSAANLGGMIGRAESGGFLTLGVWGWCAASRDSIKSECSPSSGWYNMEDDLGKGVGNISSDIFSTFLVHAMVLHGLAMLASMLAIVPVGLYVWRRYYRADETVEGGWFQHGTILAAAILALLAWIFDKLLLRSLRKELSPEDVQAGPTVTLVGCAVILLFVSFFTSTLPVFGRFARYKLSYAKGWRDLEEASDGAERARQEQDAEKGNAKGGEVVRRKKRGRTRGRIKNRVTRMFM